MKKWNLDTKKWKRRAMAFTVRAHNHLWGKNNEDPLVFLYRHNLNHDFSRQMYLGWNKFRQERPYESWGIQKKGKFLIPAGIVFPYIIDKDLKSLFIISMEEKATIFPFPGNPERRIILGNQRKDIKSTKGILQGLQCYQENPENICVNIFI